MDLELGEKQISIMSSKNPTISNQLILVALLAFLGLAPIGDPHLIGKVNWVAGGAVGMKPMDWFDFVMHGGSLLISVILILRIIYISVLKSKK